MLFCALSSVFCYLKFYCCFMVLYNIRHCVIGANIRERRNSVLITQAKLPGHCVAVKGAEHAVRTIECKHLSTDAHRNKIKDLSSHK